jgi:hypothetical protein
MRFMLIRRADRDTEAGVMPEPEMYQAMFAYNAEMTRAGVMLQGVGLHPSATGARVTVTSGVPMVTDGPFTETKELIAGFTMIEVASRDEAIAWASRWPAIDAGAVIEIRRVFEPDDFGADIAPEMEAQDRRLRARASRDTREVQS